MPCRVASLVAPCIVGQQSVWSHTPQATGAVGQAGFLAMPQHQRRSLIQLVHALKSLVADVDLAREVYPGTNAALDGLESAVESEWGRVEGNHMRGRARRYGRSVRSRRRCARISAVRRPRRS